MQTLPTGLCAAWLLWMIVLPARAEEKPEVIRLAFSGASSDGKWVEGGDALRTMERQEALENEFKSDGIRIEWIFMRSGVATTEALVQKRVDFAQQGSGQARAGRAAGLQHKLLLALSRFSADYLVVRPDSPARSLADLKGKRIGTVKGTGGYAMLCRVLDKHGFRETDFEIVNLSGGVAVRAALPAGEIDGYFMPDPFDLEARGEVKIIYRTERDSEAHLMTVFWVTEEFERRFPAIVQRVVNVLIRSAAWNCDERNREAVFRLWAHSEIERAGFVKSWTGTAFAERLSPLIDEHFLACLQGAGEEVKQFGPVAKEASLAGWVEPKYLQAALAEAHLERYWPRFDAAGRIMVETAR